MHTDTILTHSNSLAPGVLGIVRTLNEDSVADVRAIVSHLLSDRVYLPSSRLAAEKGAAGPVTGLGAGLGVGTGVGGGGVEAPRSPAVAVAIFSRPPPVRPSVEDAASFGGGVAQQQRERVFPTVSPKSRSIVLPSYHAISPDNFQLI